MGSRKARNLILKAKSNSIQNELLPRKKGYSTQGWGYGRAGYPTQCRDIIERLASVKYVCPCEVNNIIQKYADKHGYDPTKIKQHAFDNANDYLSVGVPENNTNGKRKCGICCYERSYEHDRNKEYCFLCGLEKHSMKNFCLQLQQKDYLEAYERHLKCKSNCGKILKWFYREGGYKWNGVEYSKLTYESKTIYILSKYLLWLIAKINKEKKSGRKKRKHG